MEKSLGTIQTLSKIARIVSKVIYIFCLVGAIGISVGFIAIFSVQDRTMLLEVGSVRIHNLIELEGDVSITAVYAGMVIGLILCVAEGITSYLSHKFFSYELEVGTPFDEGVADKMRKLGINVLVIPTVGAMIASVVYGSLKDALDVSFSYDIGDFAQLSIGVFLLILSVFCRYGAQSTQKRK